VKKKNQLIWIKIGKLLIDITEIYIPAISFSLLFIAFLIQVFYRYFLKRMKIKRQRFLYLSDLL
jgi:hypothetical protein